MSDIASRVGVKARKETSTLVKTCFVLREQMRKGVTLLVIVAHCFVYSREMRQIFRRWQLLRTS